MILLITLWLANAAPVPPVSAPEDALADCRASVNRLPFDDGPCTSLLSNGELQTEHVPVHQLLAVAYVRSQKMSEAAAQISAALALAPDDWSVQANAGFVYLYLNRFAQARQFLTRAMQINPDFPVFLLLNRAVASQGLGRFEEAAKDVALYTQYSEPQTPADQDCASGVSPCTPVPIVGPHPVR